jgi:ring-1,2-phenylacetyl-CoA epoxidase subunit PaaC
MNNNLFEYLLRLGDNTLVIGHRLSEWCGHGPQLEEDIALINVSLDLIGRSRSWLSYAAEIEGLGRTEDDLAFKRDDVFFRNNLICEQPNGDFAATIIRQLFFDVYTYHQYSLLETSTDKTIAAIASKSLKEIKYHVRHSKDWTLRLGDGTMESNKRMQLALNKLWRFVGDLFDMDSVDEILIKEGIACDNNTVKKLWYATIEEIFTNAKLQIPANAFFTKGSRNGMHTEHLGFLLAEMQYLPRAYPNAKWD